MTPAEHLSAAATRLRELANAASPAPWSYPGIESVAGGTLYDESRRIADIVYEQPEDHDGTIVRHLLVPEADANGAYIVAMSPPVALALADWLEAETEHVASYDCMAHCEPAGCDRGHRALALAALIVPEAAEVES